MSDWFSQFKDQLTSGEDDNALTNAEPEQQLARLQQDVIASMVTLAEKIDEFEKYVARLSKEQFKANTLTENALAQLKAVRNLAGAPQDQPAANERSLPLKQSEAETRLMEALMPILDGIEAGLASGQAQSVLIGDQRAQDTLVGWLEGQRLLRDRLLALFDKENIRPIDTIGQAFDPYLHVAVETVYDPARPTGTIVEERRRGYTLSEHVLRFAEVVVTRSYQV